MKLDPTSYYINNVVALKESAKEYLRAVPERSDSDTRKPTRLSTIKGGILSNIRYSWTYRGPKLQILDTRTGGKIATWNFGSALDFDVLITCITELPNTNNQGKLPVLIVGLECEIGGGLICLFDVNTSRLIRTIQLDDRVTTIHVVNAGCDASFPGALRAMDGVLAVGTSCGKIILIDLCRQICDYNNDNPELSHLNYLSLYDLNNLEQHKDRSLNDGKHLALQINETSTSGVHFALHGPNGEVRLHANMEEVAVSALHYCPQLGSLLVGFNFGAFQIYNLLNIKLVYTSPVYEDCIPITHFALQEPCDDPRAFCYIWVVYNIIETGDTGFPMAVMYALAYETKDYLEGYGHLYQEFSSCCVRFQLELGAVPGFHLLNSGCSGARCISLNSYTKPLIKHGDIPDDKLALCSIVWIAWNQTLTATETYLTLFDLNQWYKEQMPSSTRLEQDALSYMSCESLSQLFDLNSGNLLDVRIDRSTLNPFVVPQRLEEHYYPTALAFQATCLQDSNIIWLGNYGVQRHLLTLLEQAGPLRLLRPTDLFHRCISLGLTPQYTDVLYSVSTPVNIQREMILNVALEHQLIRWLCACARDWSNGSQAMGGCTLDFLLDWAWQRANTLKFQSDKLCVPLFDHQGIKMDSNAMVQLNHCTNQIKQLSILFETVVVKCNRFLLEQDVEDIKYQMKSLQMISIYLEVLQWLLNVGLLPECPLSMYPLIDDEKISAPYPVDTLVQFYESRRNELNNSTNPTEETNDLLFIDNLITLECNGNILRKQWECDGGNGLYPPPSLQSVLRAYLIEDIDIKHKHCLLIYLFLDLAMTLDQSQYKPIITHLIKFPAVFKLSPSVIKITQAFWQLDHGDFSTAMSQLLDPSISNDDLKPWHHRIVLRALLVQGQHQHALLYQQVRKPPVSNIQDICIIITLLIVNDLLQEAFHFQRYNRSTFNEKQILKHFFSVCERMNQQSSILHLPLDSTEETEFIEYLKSHANENNKNFLVIYYLQRDRYGEAFQINDRLNSEETLKQGLIGQQEKNFRNAIISGFKKTLPEVTQQLLDYCKEEKKNNPTVLTLGKRPEPIPMSVQIHEHETQTKYKSTLIQASFQKAKELWNTPKKLDLNNTPFISTPKLFKFTAERSIIYPEMLDTSRMSSDIEDCETPSKRIKLSPRRSINQFKARLSSSCNNSLLNTPIVKRKSFRSMEDAETIVRIGTPTSILKTRPSVVLRRSITPDSCGELRETSVTPELLPKEQNKSRISPRRSISRTPRPAVHFQEERSVSRSSNESDTQSQLQPQTDSKNTSQNSSKNSSRSTSDDIFYSPNSSINTSEEPSIITRSLKRKAIDSSISSRRSYKPSPSSSTSTFTTASSPSIKNTSIRDSLKQNETNIKIIVTEPPQPQPQPEAEPPQQIESPKIVAKVSGRRSLSRQVLENNLFAKVVTPSPRMSTRLSLTKLTDADKKRGVEVTYSKSVTSFVKTVTDDKVEEKCDIKTIEKMDEFSSEKNEDNSALIIKHVHNETETKKNITKIEIMEDIPIESLNNSDKDKIIEEKSDEKMEIEVEVEADEELQKENETHEDKVEASSSSSDEEEKISNQDEDEDDEIEHNAYEVEVVTEEEEEEDEAEIEEDLTNKNTQTQEEVEHEDEDEMEQQCSASSSSSSSSSSSEVSSESDVILVRSSSEDSSSNKPEQFQLNEIYEEQEQHEKEQSENTEEEEEENNVDFHFHLEESVDDDNNDDDDDDNSEDEIEKEDAQDTQMKDINEDNTDKNNELFINEDIEEMENVEFITEPQEQQEQQEKETNEAIELLEAIIESQPETIKDKTIQQVEESSANVLEQNVIEITETTIQPEDKTSANIIEITETTIHPPEEDSTENVLEQNIIEISETTIQPETIIQEEEEEENPLEQNIIEISETTIQPETIIQEEEEEENPLEQNIIVISETINDEEINPLEKNIIETPSTSTSTPAARRTRSNSQSSETKPIKTPTRTSARRRSIDQKLTEETPPPVAAARAQRITRTPRSSVDEKPSESTRSTSRRKSTDETPRKTRAPSIISLEVIEEDRPIRRTRRAASVDLKPETENPRQRRGQSLEPESTVIKRGGRKRTLQPPVDLQSIPEKIEEYSSTHRLTRHQKSIMEKSLIKQEKSRLEHLHEDEEEEEAPVRFLGSPDKERTVSPASSVSTTQSIPENPGTPKRKRGRPSLSGSAEKKSPARVTRTPTRRSSRLSSHELEHQDEHEDTESVISVSSVMSVPVVQLRQLRDRDVDVVVARHRSLSPTALKEETQKNRRRSTRSTNLAKISEESNSSVETKPRRTRRKTETTETTETTSSTTGTRTGSKSELRPRRSSYKPLENYLPGHAIVKTRKSFKVRKYSQSRDSSPP